jgi:hypothetical protein
MSMFHEITVYVIGVRLGVWKRLTMTNNLAYYETKLK